MARTAKDRQKPKANERKPPNYTLQHAVHETRSTEANASNNTGSAVLAPHGALGLKKRVAEERENGSNTPWAVGPANYFVGTVTHNPQTIQIINCNF